MHLQGDLLNWPLCRLHQDKNDKTNQKKFRKKVIILFRNRLAGPVNLVKLAWTSRSQYLFENYFFVFYIQPGQISVKRFVKWLFLAVLSENTVQCLQTLFLCRLYIYTFPIASFWFFVQWIDLGSKNPLQRAQFRIWLSELGS